MNQKTENIILGIEMEISLIEKDLESIDVDMNYLKKYREVLSYNKVFLKKNNIITSMFEYKRTVKELLQIDTKLSKLQKTYYKLINIMSIKKDSLNYYFIIFRKEKEIEDRKVLMFGTKNE